MPVIELSTVIRAPRERVFDRRTGAIDGYQEAGLATLWAEHQAAAANHSWALWRWISLAEWLEMHARGWWRAGTTSLLA